MKKPIFYLAQVIFLFVCLYACNKEQTIGETLPQSLQIIYQKDQHFIQSKSDLEAFIKIVVGVKEVEILESSFEKITDERGAFYAIRAAYIQEGLNIVMTIPLNEAKEVSKTGTGEATTYFAECTMTCSPPIGCSRCNQTVYERCARQSCSCAEGGPWGCNAEVVF